MIAEPSVGVETPVERVLSRLEGVKRSGTGWIAKCPCHHDRTPSLGVDEGKDSVCLINCHAGCEPAAIVAAIGLEWRDLWPPDAEPPRVKVRESRFEIRNGAGELQAVHVRIRYSDGSKDDPWRGADDNWGLNGRSTKSLPFYGSETRTPATRRIVITEGEAARDALLALLGSDPERAVLGTVCGASAIPDDAVLETILGLDDICLWPDNDDAGATQMRRIRDRLVALGRPPDRIRFVDWRDAPAKGDAADFVDAGHGPEDALALLAAAKPRPASASTRIDPTGTERSTSTPAWPVLDDAALYGLAGAIVRAVDPHTEGDPVATLVNTLVMFGSAVGPSPHALVGDRPHRANEFAALVGRTAKSRKGTSHDTPEAIIAAADPDWLPRIQGGMSSGEGLIWAVRDPVTDVKDGEATTVDAGEPDKRLLAVEEEFTGVLKVAGREGNTLSEIIRRAWDGKPLQILTKTRGARCGSPHISILGHSTQMELQRELTDVSAANGFGNRFLWILVRRSKVLPEGGRLPDSEREELIDRTRKALEAARKIGTVRRSDEARELWGRIYPDLSEPGIGLWGAITDRAEAHVLRLSLIYALLDCSRVITVVHLLAALSLWDYAAASARYLFGDATGDPIADRILTTLRRNGPMAQSEVTELLGRNVNAGRMGKAFETLIAAGLAHSEQVETKGRPRTVWRAR